MQQRWILAPSAATAVAGLAAVAGVLVVALDYFRPILDRYHLRVLVQNAFFRAILPGFEREVSRAGR